MCSPFCLPLPEGVCFSSPNEAIPEPRGRPASTSLSPTIPRVPGLHPKRVLVTRSRQQSSALAVQLTALGIDPILIPTIAIAPPESYAALDTALTFLDTYDWLVFTSANAVQAFASRAKVDAALGQRPPWVPHPLAPFAKGRGIAQSATALPDPASNLMPKIAAIGSATAQALTSIGLTPDLIPPQAVAESLAQTLLPHIILARTRILLVRAETARDTLPDQLRAAGAHLNIAPAYRNVIPHESIPLLQELFRSPVNWPDAITFTSSSIAANLLTLLETAGLELPPDGAHGKTILRASIGPITSQTLRDLGHPPHLEAPQSTVAALAQTVAHHLRKPLP